MKTDVHAGTTVLSVAPTRDHGWQPPWWGCSRFPGRITEAPAAKAGRGGSCWGREIRRTREVVRLRPNRQLITPVGRQDRDCGSQPQSLCAKFLGKLGLSGR
ncbi:hypothetical protein GCM10010387_36450 [Streptomyces inusitatus]|uniref:Uncharacterized protein n=1 Tax=Streptomyces inusitatus TaxID=68221 RepID=A0A918QBM2_9ACTN|nr:hypothetical protein GCM10010387_36450 [Streptomyces inusitatus]